MRFLTPTLAGQTVYASRSLIQVFAGGPTPPAAISTGLGDLDRLQVMRGGLPTVISGRPGVGTTSLVLSIVWHVLRTFRGAVIYVTDHLSVPELEERLLAQHARVDLHHLQHDRLDQHQSRRREASLDELTRSDLVVIDASLGLPPTDIARCCDQLARAGCLPRLLVIDRIDSLRPNVPSTSTSSPDSVAVLLDLVERHQVATLLVEGHSPEDSEPAPQRPLERPTASVSRLHRRLANRLNALLWLERPEMRDPQTPDRGIGDIHVLWQRQGAVGHARAAFLHHLGAWRDLRRSARSG